jgi:NADH-quinone oxidoreductase E subunit
LAERPTGRSAKTYLYLGEGEEMAEPLDLSKIEPILEKYEGQNGALIPILQEVQAMYGYLPEEVLTAISKGLNIPVSRVYGVVTFYAQFYLNPRGQHTVRVCRGTACHVRGGKNVLKAVQQHLRIGENETTEDFKFTYETVACLGACALAPVLLVDKTYYGKLTPARVEQVLKQYS